MSTIRKKDFINLVLENISDVEEMAIRPKKVQAARKDKEGNLIIPQFVSVWSSQNPTKPGEDGIPDGWIVNANRIAGEERLIIPMGTCNDIIEFVKEKKEILEELRIAHKLNPELFYCVSKVNPRGVWHSQPRQIPLKTGWMHKGVYESATETIKRWLYESINLELDNDAMIKFFDDTLIPTVESRDIKHLDKYSLTNNNEVNYQTHSYLAFKDEDQFLKFVISRMSGIDIPDKSKTYYLARQFNDIYRNWEETKKQKPEYKGKTLKYLLDTYGLDPDNTSMVIRMDLKITGKLMGDTYNWTIQYIVRYGSKLKTDRRIKDGLKLDKDIVVNKSTQLASDRPFEDSTKFDSYTIVDDSNIRGTFYKALSELKNRIVSEIEPIHAMTRLSTMS
jgi:hypothetical protein